MAKKSTKDKILEILPMEQDFRISHISDRIYPHLIRYDTEGRIFNRGNSAMARILRNIKGIQEIDHCVFYVHKEYFLDE